MKYVFYGFNQIHRQRFDQGKPLKIPYSTVNLFRFFYKVLMCNFY